MPVPLETVLLRQILRVIVIKFVNELVNLYYLSAVKKFVFAVDNIERAFLMKNSGNEGRKCFPLVIKTWYLWKENGVLSTLYMTFSLKIMLKVIIVIIFYNIILEKECWVVYLSSSCRIIIVNKMAVPGSWKSPDC